MPFDFITENGIIICKNVYIKIIKIIPINYDLKSNLEKESILNSYKLFLKTCNFDIQIIIQSKNENFNQYFFNLKEISEKEENKKIKEITEDYISFIQEKLNDNKSSSKNFYIVLNYEEKNEKVHEGIRESLAINDLSEKYFKVKETLSRCGNIIYEINTKDEVVEILCDYFRIKKI